MPFRWRRKRRDADPITTRFLNIPPLLLFRGIPPRISALKYQH